MSQIQSSASSQVATPKSEPTNASAASPKPEAPARLLSLDALRGFDMIWITGFGSVIVALAKLIGSKELIEFAQKQTEHGPWIPPDYGRWAQGATFWDLIMPLFLFCTGTSLPFSIAKRRRMGDSTATIYRHMATRFALLWVLGMIAQGNLLAFDLSKLQLFSNTLQAIAVGYVIASVLYLHFKPRWQVILTAALLFGFWALLTFVPAPGADSVKLLPKQTIADWIDATILGRFDDGGLPYTWILSGMGFACSVMLGVFAGQWLRSPGAARTKVLGLLGAGVFLVAAGWLWSGWFPIIKYLWNSSMVLYWGGWSLILLGLFYLFIDVLNWRKPAFPLVVVGCNAITAYMIVHVVRFKDIARNLVGGLEHLAPTSYPLILAGATFFLLWLLLFWMYRTKTFLKV